MTLLELLSEEKPFHRKRMLDGLREIIREHFCEIKQAREKGYSWSQIHHSMRQLCPEACYRSCPAERIFNELRKELSK